MKLSIIIVNYNVKEFLQNLLHSIDKAAQNIEHEIIIIDNASTDGSIEFIQEKFPYVDLIINEKNLGFSKANNEGLKKAKGEYLLLLNPDTIVREDTFEMMIEFFEQNRGAGLAGCKILNPDGTLQLACRRSFPGPWVSFCKVTGLSNIFPGSRIFARYNLTYLDENETYEVDAISGSFMMFTREVYENVGGLDEQFFMYGEDLDLCYRIQKAGYKVYYVHNTQIIHYKGESTKRSSLDETKIFYNAMHLFVRKHFSSSLLIEAILQSAIGARKFLAFWGKRKLVLLSILLDFILYSISIIAAEKIYQSIRPTWQGFHEYHMPIILTVPAFLHIITGALSGVYRKTSFSVLKNFAAIIISFVIVSSVTFFVKEFAYSRAVLIITYILLFFVLTSWRVVLKLLFKVGIQDEDRLKKRALVVGIHGTALNVAKKIQSRYALHSVIGLIGLSAKEVGDEIEGFKVVGSTENIRNVIRETKANTVIFSAEELSYNSMMTIVSACQNENVEFQLIGNNLDFLVGKTSVSILDDIPLIEINYNIAAPVHRVIKTSFDIGMSLAVLFFIYPFIYLAVLMGGKRTVFKDFILKVPSVLGGKKSFVGPREGEKEDGLFLGKEGLTGLWYIDSNSEGGSEKLDIYYAKNQNIWLDLEIIGRTLNKMWSNRS